MLTASFIKRSQSYFRHARKALEKRSNSVEQRKKAILGSGDGGAGLVRDKIGRIEAGMARDSTKMLSTRELKRRIRAKMKRKGYTLP